MIKNMADKEKGRLISEISQGRNDIYMKTLVRLIDILVEDTRVENDRAGVRAVFRNQGKIEGLMQLRDYIERGFPTINNLS